MRDPYTPTQLRATLQFLIGSDIPSEHKSVLFEMLTQALRAQDVEREEQLEAHTERPWQVHELANLNEFLQGTIAKSWQQGDEVLMRLSTRLRRSPHEIKNKARELGLDAGVDFAIARRRIRQSDEDDR